ncbi:hypothetical protein MUK42_12848 [Musa troglodytarum]|uniref:Uncharacterized protein n=1 Tax=Musa troglodytarum TaxID=320322 RepID=A0A9E7I0R5_9LILI|nr:hypothetical protein MUK42_12848 [Musa troglodytarum]
MFMRGLLVDQSRDGIVSHRICLGSGPSLMLYAMLTEDQDVKCMVWNSYEDDLGCIPDFKVHSSTLTEIVTQEVHLFNHGIQKVNITEKKGYNLLWSSSW